MLDITKLKLPRTLRLDSHDAVMITSGSYPERKILYVNTAFARLTGFAASEWLGRSGDLLLADGLLRMESLVWLEAEADGREAHWIARLHRRDGTPFCAEAHLHSLMGADGNIEYVALVMTDVTSRRGHGKSYDATGATTTTATFEIRNTA